jgi:hypothetical protein
MKQFLLSLLWLASVMMPRAATIFSEDFEGVTAPSGSSTNLTTTGLSNWNCTEGSFDIVSATHPLAPLGTATQFLDALGGSTNSRVRRVASGLTVSTTYTLTFKCAMPAGDGIAPLQLNIFNPAGNWGGPLIRNYAPTVAQTSSAGYSGTYPTNLTATVTYTPSAAAWATNKWVTNSVSFVAPSTSVVVEFFVAARSTDHASYFIDDVAMTAP